MINKLLIMTIIMSIIIIGLISVSAIEEKPIPAWIKNTAGWWSEGIVSDAEFVDSLQFLVDGGILIIDNNKTFIPSVVIHTEKKQYEKGERIDITISNNGNVPIFISHQPVIKIFNKDRNFMALFSTPSSHFRLMNDEIKTFSWDQKRMPHIDLNPENIITQVDSGEYQIEITYFVNTNMPNFGSQYTLNHYIEII